MGRRAVLSGFTIVENMMSVLIKNIYSKFSLVQFTAEANTKDLEILASLIKNEEIKVHIEKIFSYENLPEAIGHIETMCTKGKVAITWKSVN